MADVDAARARRRQVIDSMPRTHVDVAARTGDEAAPWALEADVWKVCMPSATAVNLTCFWAVAPGAMLPRFSGNGVPSATWRPGGTVTRERHVARRARRPCW